MKRKRPANQERRKNNRKQIRLYFSPQEMGMLEYIARELGVNLRDYNKNIIMQHAVKLIKEAEERMKNE